MTSTGHQELVQRLPLPLGQLLRRALNAKTALERHQAAYYLWEASLKLLASAVIVEYASLGDQDLTLAERLKNLARPSLGHWWEFVRRLLPVAADSIAADSGGGSAGARAARDLVLGRMRDDLPRAAGLDSLLRECLEGGSGARSTVRLSELFDRLVRYRNQELGHGAAGQRPGDFYERMGQALLGGVAEILERLDVLLGRTLVFVSDVRRQLSADWLVERYELAGETARRIESLVLPDSEKDRLPRPGRLYLAAASELRAIHPLLLFDPEAGECFFLNAKRGSGSVQYLSYSTGGLREEAALEADRRELLSRILGAPVDGAQAKTWAERSEREEAPLPDAEKAAPPRRSIGEFELLARLGRGGMGVVYRAWQPSLARQVALKCLLRSGDPKVEARFAREIRALGRVDHPNLVKVFTSGSEGDQWFYAMELIEGADLASVTDHMAKTSASEVDATEWARAISTASLEARQKEQSLGGTDHAPPKALPTAPPEASRGARRTGLGHLDQAVRVVRQAAEAAHALHESGVIHRDIKPGNIMLSADGSHAVLMDLGVAQLADEADGRLTRTRQFVGTLRYASPEQVLAAGTLDRRTDIYSLGATLYEVLTLKPLFGATDDMPTPELMLKIQSGEPERPRKLNPRIPADLEAIVLKSIEKDRARRYGTARELAEDLGRFERGEPVEARAPTLGYVLSKTLRRHRGKIVVTGAFLLLAVALGVLFIRHRRESALAAAAGYERQVERAVLRMEVASLTQKGEAGEGLFFGPGESKQYATPRPLDALKNAMDELDAAARALPGRPDAVYHRARGLLFLGQTREALEALEGLAGRFPSFVPGRLLQAAIEQRHGEHDKARAIREGTKAAASAPWAQAWVRAYEAAREDRPGDEEKAYGDLLEESRRQGEPFVGATPLARLRRGAARLETKDHAGAIEDFVAVEVFSPDAIEPALLKGKAWHLIGKPEIAANVFERAFERAPYRDEVAVAVGWVHHGLGDGEGRLRWFTRVGIPYLRERLRRDALSDLGRHEEAIRAGRAVLELKPDSAEDHIALADVLNSSGYYYNEPAKMEEMGRLYEKAVSLAPDVGWIRAERGWFLITSAKLEEAEAELRKALELDPGHWYTYIELARLLSGYHDKGEEARRLLDEAVGRRPGSGYVYGQAAFIRFNLMGDLHGAFRDYSRAAELSPSRYSYWHKWKGITLEKLGRIEEAVESLRRAAQGYPRDWMASYRLGDLLLRRGLAAEAFTAYVDALEIDAASFFPHIRIAWLLGAGKTAVPEEGLVRLQKILEPASERRNAGTFNTLAWVRLHATEPALRARAAEALAEALERTVDDPGALDHVLATLEEAARVLAPGRPLLAVLPRLPPFAAIDAVLERSPVTDKPERTALASAFDGGADAPARARSLYLQAKLLRADGRPKDAAAKIEEAMMLAPGAAEPLLELTRALGDAEGPARAEETLRRGLEGPFRESRRAWGLWAIACLDGLGLAPSAALARCPPAPGTNAAAEQVRWLLERLAEGGTVRIDCGEEEDHRDPEGRAWGRDRFALGGRTSRFPAGSIAGTEADRLYLSERFFPYGYSAVPAYRIPLPRGRYRVTLHFAEIYFRVPGERVYDVLLEGRTVLERHEPIQAGFRTAKTWPFEAEVTDGFLDIRFQHWIENPQVSAIEIDRVP